MFTFLKSDLSLCDMGCTKAKNLDPEPSVTPVTYNRAMSVSGRAV